MVTSGKRGPGARTPARSAKVMQTQVQARLAVNLPANLHRQIKIRAAQRGVSIRDYILMLLSKDGIG
jgi:hypothetical protein